MREQRRWQEDIRRENKANTTTDIITAKLVTYVNECLPCKLVVTLCRATEEVLK